MFARRSIVVLLAYLAFALVGQSFHHSYAGTTTIIAWPAAGVGLAFVTVWGRSMCWALFIAAFLSSFLEPSTSLGESAAFALAAVAQALVGTMLLTIYGRYNEEKLLTSESVLRFVVIVAPLACVIVPTAEVAFLALKEPGETATLLSYSWALHWFAETIGCTLVTPIILFWADRAFVPLKHRFVASVLLGSVLMALYLVSSLASQSEAARLRSDFSRRSVTIEQSIKKQLSLYFENLFSVRQLFQASDVVSRNDFSLFVRPILDRRRGIQALEWTPRVTAEQREDFERRARASGLKGFEITEPIQKNIMTTRRKAAEYFPIFYVEPLAGNEEALGYDISVTDTPRANLYRARDSGQLEVSPPFTLVQERSTAQGVVGYIAVYQRGAQTDSLEERRRAIKGVVAGVFRLSDVIASALDGVETSDLSILVYDRGVGRQEGLLFSTSGEPEVVSGFSRSTIVPVGHRNWELLIRAKPSYLTPRLASTMWLVPSGNMIIGMIVAALILMMFGRAAEVERTVLSRTAELDAAHKKAELMAKISSALNDSTLDASAILQKVGQMCIPQFADWCTVDLKLIEGAKRIPGCHADPEKYTDIKRLSRHFPASSDGRSPASEVLRTGKSVLVPEVTDQYLRQTTNNQEHYEIVCSLGAASLVSVPIIYGDKLIGALSFIISGHARHFEEDDLLFAEEIARRVASAMNNAMLYAEAKKAVQLRDDFLSIASHELKTPLTPLKMKVELMKKLIAKDFPEVVNEKQRGVYWLADTMGKQVTRLAALVDDLLDVSRISSQKLTLTTEPLDLSSLLRDVIELFSDEFRKANCEVVTNIEDGVRGVWDRNRVEQVVINLLTNAAKYGRNARIEVTLKTTDDRVRLSVRDYGIGMSREDTLKIFGMFERVASSSHYGGLGLGLYISERIVKAHGGEITVQSVSGEGSLFVVDLPRETKTKQAA